MRKMSFSFLSRYSVAGLTIAAALLLKLIFDHLIGEETPFLLFFIAVIVSAWHGGLGPGLLATALAAIVGSFFFLEPVYSFAGLEKNVRLGVFVLEGVLISLLSTALLSARRRTEVSEGRYRSLVENVQDYAIFSMDTSGRMESWNEGAERIFGFKEAETIGQHFSRLFTPEDIEGGAPERELAKVAAEGRAEDERWHVRKDGTRFYASGVTTDVRDEAGVLRGFAKVARDITDRKLAQEALRESEERYQKLVELSPDTIVVHSEGKIVFINTAGVRLLHASGPEVIIGKSVLDFVHPDYREIVVERLQRLSTGEAVPPLEMKFIRLDGADIDGDVVSVPFIYKGKQAVQVVIRDIGDRRRAEEALREANQRAIREYERLLERVTNLAQTLGTARDLAVIFRSLKEFTIASVPGSGIFISLYDPEGQTRSAVYAWSEGEEVDVSALSPMPMSDSPHSRAVATGEVIITDDFQAAMTGKPVHHVGLERDPHLPQSSLAVPMAVMGRIVGAVEVQSTEPAAYRQEHAAAMLLAANLAAVAIENVRLLEHESSARTAAEEANRLKDEFLAVVSHELRTPLTSIFGWARLLRSGDLNELMTARALEAIERNAQSQRQLIDDILDVSRIITGRLRLDTQPITLVPVIEAAVDIVRPAAAAKHIKLDVSIAPQTGLIFGDPDRLRQVIWNLLSNAIKFTPEGGSVAVRLERKDSSALFQVSDTGQGIGPEFLPYVFDRFRQADATTTRAHGGLGLGLAIVRHLVELHGGAVTAESKGPGQGATFTVSLPLAAAHTEATEPAPLTSEAPADEGYPPALNDLRVLIVDDETDTLEFLTTVLEERGAEVTAATSVSEALRAFERTKPDVLISDIGMAGEDGYELIRKVRALGVERGGRIPAVALTAYAREEDRLKALRAGYQMHLAKPVEPAELAAVVASFAGRAGKV